MKHRLRTLALSLTALAALTTGAAHASGVLENIERTKIGRAHV